MPFSGQARCNLRAWHSATTNVLPSGLSSRFSGGQCPTMLGARRPPEASGPSHFQLGDLEPDSRIAAPLSAASEVGLPRPPTSSRFADHAASHPLASPGALASRSLAGLFFTSTGTDALRGQRLGRMHPATPNPPPAPCSTQAVVSKRPRWAGELPTRSLNRCSPSAAREGAAGTHPQTGSDGDSPTNRNWSGNMSNSPLLCMAKRMAK